MNQVPSVGRIVHVRNKEGQCRPAIVTRVWSPGNPMGAIQLTGFPDATNDGEPFAYKWITSAVPEEEDTSGNGPWQFYHWPERVES